MRGVQRIFKGLLIGYILISLVLILTDSQTYILLGATVAVIIYLFITKILHVNVMIAHRVASVCYLGIGINLLPPVLMPYIPDLLKLF